MIDWECKTENDYTEFYLEKCNQQDKKILNEFCYRFRALRLKDEETRKEFLKLTVYAKDFQEEKDYTEEVSVIINMKNLDQGLIDLREYGIIFSDDNSRLKLKRRIESVYRSIKLEMNEEIGEWKNKRFNEFLMLVYEHFISYQEGENTKENTKENRSMIKKNLYHIEIKEFDKLAMDFGYKEFEILSLRRKLKKEGIIETNHGRHTRGFRFQGKVITTIAFDIDKLKKQEELEGINQKEEQSKQEEVM